MASSSTQPAPLTSSSTDPREYEVFLSFRGIDTRRGFADALYHAMKNIGIIVFRDREDLEVGEEINPALAAAIKESQYAVVVLSPQYAQSKACLFELFTIMKCKRMGRLTVFPIFYHVSPSEVGKLMEDVENIFTISEGNPEAAKAKWETWKSILGKLGDYSVDPELDKDLPESCRRALKEASDLSAMVVDENSYETEVAREISFKVFSKLVFNSPITSDHVVGIESPMIEIMELLNPRDPVRVRVIGICGLPGMGKSILAEEVHDRVSTQFEGQCILYRIGKTTSHKYLVGLQKKLISNILGQKAAKALGDDDQKVKSALRTRLRKRKVFIVLDDVSDNIQIKYLAESLEWFGDGSKIIITSQKHDLDHLCPKSVYVVQPLNEKDAPQLFCWKAFKQCEPKEGFEKLAAEFSSHARGLPFAIVSFGSYLSNKGSRDAWEAYLEEIHGNNPIDETLVKRFDELAHKHQELFLDITCFFSNCDLNRILWIDINQMLKYLGYNPKYDLGVLKDKSILRISKGGELLMHDFLVDLGQKLAQGKRLCRKNDIVQTLKASTASCKENPDIIAIDLHEFVPEELSLKALSTMVNLRMLNIWPENDLKWLGDLSKLSKELGILQWYRYPLYSLPNDSNFGIKLVTLKLFEGNIHTLWVGEKSFPELKNLYLYLKELIVIPDLSGMPKLEILYVWHCNKLSNLPPSVGNLKLLERLSIRQCKDLQELPDEILSTSLKHLSLKGCPRLKDCPKMPHSLQCLQHLSISGISIEGLPLSHESLPSLEFFKANLATLEELPSFIFSSKKLADLSIKKLDGNPNFQLPTSFSTLSSLKGLALCHMNMSDETGLHSLSCLSSLRNLNLSYCNLKAIPESIVLCSVLYQLALNGNNFTNLPDIIWKLSELGVLELNSCTFLESLPKLPLSLIHLFLRNCPKLLGCESQTRTCSLIVAYVGFDEKPHKVLHLPGKEEEKEGLDKRMHPSVVCGPALESPNSTLFPHKATHSNRTIEIRMDLNAYGERFRPSACVLFIVYEFHHGNEERGSKKQKIDKPKSSDSGAFKGRNCVFPELDCKIYHMEGDEEIKENAFVVSVPEAAQLRSSYEVWVFINLRNFFPNPHLSESTEGTEITEETESTEESEGMQRWSYSASIKARNENVELKKCWARLIDKSAPSEFFEEINRISRPGLDSKSLPESLKSLTVEFSESGH